MRRSALVLWLAAPLLLVLSLYRPFTPSAGRARALPARLDGFALGAELAMTPRHFELLGTNDAVWRTYRADDGRELYVVAVFHQDNWKSVHPPHICLEGSDMTIRVDDQAALADGTEVGRIVAYSRSEKRDYVSLYAYGAVGLVTRSYLGFVLHHAPAAVLRRSTAGFLVRVETWVDAAGEAAAQAACTRLVEAMLPSAKALLGPG